LQGGEGRRFGRRLKSFGEKRNRRRERERGVEGRIEESREF
jgi:hypothetical protein